ncbi:MAG TPA: prephenate dehydrogenase/arogenate dehydrogenase family protein [Thermoleophilia bacterium]|nr:prephenate dehydrogenase/arogenate dehydrogenase family protein [Thermoleophilia bacterium]
MAGESLKGGTLAVVGVGLMGGSLGLAARGAGVAEVLGVSRSRETLDLALARGAITAACESVTDAAAAADLVVVATPVQRVVDDVKAALRASGPETIVTDVGSTKGPLMRALTPKEQARCIGGHPLCGSEAAGVANARHSLYEGAIYFLTPGAHVDADAYRRLSAFVTELGARPVAIDPEEHDRLMAVVSHLPHVLANILMTQAGRHAGTRDALLSAGPSFRDVTRIAGSNRRVWTDIFLDNRAALLAELATFQEGLQKVVEALAAGDAEQLGETIAAAAAHRERMLAEESLPPAELYRVVVTISDRPGALKEIMVALGDANINIEDIAFHHMSAELGGTLTVYVLGEEACRRAGHLLAGLGYETMTGPAVE